MVPPPWSARWSPGRRPHRGKPGPARSRTPCTLGAHALPRRAAELLPSVARGQWLPVRCQLVLHLYYNAQFY